MIVRPMSTMASPNPWTRASQWCANCLRWLADSRAHRVICLVAGIWIINTFDLLLTIIAHQHGLLQEENPLARRMLAYGTPSIVLFKIGLVLLGTYPFIRFRRARVTELGAIVILVAYTLLAVHWRTCYELYAITATNSRYLAELTSAAG